MGIKDNMSYGEQVGDAVGLMGTAGFDRKEDELRRAKWAEAYASVLQQVKCFPGCGVSAAPGSFLIVGWAERGSGSATGRGNSVPRFHVTWGTGPGVLEQLLGRVKVGKRQSKRGAAVLRFRHRVG